MKITDIQEKELNNLDWDDITEIVVTTDEGKKVSVTGNMLELTKQKIKEKLSSHE